MNSGVVIGLSFGYLALLFAVAYLTERRARTARSLVNNPYVYALSLSVYCSAWTYYGSVGGAVTNGMEYLAVYIGPALMAPVFWIVLRKIIRICKVQRITSIADFISSRYGKSSLLGVMVAVFCLLEAIPYLALQLKAIASSLDTLARVGSAPGLHPGLILRDTTFYLTLGLAFFVILFGTRRVEATEQHEGMVGAVAFESLVKLVAFLAAGVFVTYGVFNGFGDIFLQASRVPRLVQLFVVKEPFGFANWTATIFLSAMAVLLLPRQFQVAVVENLNEKHLSKAIWLFPLYLLVINLFVLPIAFGGKLVFGTNPVDADTYVLALPMHFGKHLLALLVYIGGFSAATGMIIVTVIALSTMTSTNLVMPLVVKSPWLKRRFADNFVNVLIYSRRVSMVVILLLAYAYFKGIAGYYSLISTGLVAFAAVAQFAPSVLGGIFWKRGSRNGAVAGILAGFVIWVYTLVIPSAAGAGLLPAELMEEGLFGLSWLRPVALFGLETFDYIPHALFWSMFFNVSLYVGFSLFGSRSALERGQAEIFVDVFRYSRASENTVTWRGTAYMPDIRSLLVRFLGEKRTAQALQSFYFNNASVEVRTQGRADARLVGYAEKLLAGVIGAASARIMVASVVKEEEIGIDEVVDILKESQQQIALNEELRKKSQELKRATKALHLANQRLKQTDELKDEFLYTVTHELRTPITSIRAFSEILFDNPELSLEERQHFLATVIKETERLSRLITHVLDLEKFESGKHVLTMEVVEVPELIMESLEAVSQLMREKNITLSTDIVPGIPAIQADRDKLLQVLLNLLSNAIKFCDVARGSIELNAYCTAEGVEVCVTDNGRGVDTADQQLIFDKFYQTKHQTTKKPIGSGLGLAISKKIVELHAGKIWVQSRPGQGASFLFSIPFSKLSQPIYEPYK
jgi:signal transduction histidine kinase